MRKKPQDEFVFDGFEQSNTTPVPDIFFDKLLSKLSGAEIKVLLYIIRRTAGFKKTSDAISLTQFEKGIVKGDGTVLDEGCGLSRETICKTLDSLEAKGYIKRHKRNGTGTNNDVSLYSIRFKGEPRVVRKSDQVVRKSDQQKGSQKNRPASQIRRKKVVRKSDPQETVIQQTEGTYGDGNSETTDNSLSSTHSSLSVSLENASLQDLYARINQLEQQGPELEHLPTPIVDKGIPNVEKSELPIAIPTNSEPVTTGNASTTVNVRNTEPLLSNEGERVRDYWSRLGFESTSASNTHWNTLSKHIASFEQMDSLFKHTQAWMNDNPRITDKQVHPGNLVHCLNGWKQAQTPLPAKPTKRKLTYAEKMANPV